jgi:hypothetical protein
MQRSWLKLTAALCVAAALFAGASARAADAKGFVGNWKLTDVTNGNELTYVLFQVEEKDGKLQAKVLAAPLLPEGETKIENFKADATGMQFDVKFARGTLVVKAYAPKADAKNKDVLGSITFGTQLMLVQFDKTDDKTLTEDAAVTQTDEAKQLFKAQRTRDAKDQQDLLKELVEKNGDKAVAYTAAGMLLRSYSREAPKDEDLKATAEKYLKIGARFGPDAEQRALANACKAMALPEKVSPVAVEFMRNAEKTMLKDMPAATTVVVLKSLATALKKSGKEEDAKALEPRIAKLDMILDAEFEKDAVPFKVGEYKGRKGDSKRVAVVELFTGAYCPPCVAADVAFDAALESYKPKDVILLQYHLHIPQPDRLTNADTDARYQYYGGRGGTPTTLLNGKLVQQEITFMGQKQLVGLGGGKEASKDSYNVLRDQIDEALETEATAALQLNVERKGDKLDIVGEVTNLKKPGENMKLRFVLIEEVARYPGSNGQRLHHHVVRALPGGTEGFALKDKTAKQNVAVNLADLRTSLDEYMTKFNKSDDGPFVDDEHPLNLKKLKVVALIQDDDSKEILQAVQINVPDAN